MAVDREIIGYLAESIEGNRELRDDDGKDGTYVIELIFGGLGVNIAQRRRGNWVLLAGGQMPKWIMDTFGGGWKGIDKTKRGELIAAIDVAQRRGQFLKIETLAY